MFPWKNFPLTGQNVFVQDCGLWLNTWHSHQPTNITTANHQRASIIILNKLSIYLKWLLWFSSVSQSDEYGCNCLILFRASLLKARLINWTVISTLLILRCSPVTWSDSWWSPNKSFYNCSRTRESNTQIRACPTRATTSFIHLFHIYTCAPQVRLWHVKLGHFPLLA